MTLYANEDYKTLSKRNRLWERARERDSSFRLVFAPGLNVKRLIDSRHKLDSPAAAPALCK